jgi:superfamily II DNA or RNA helicase
LTLEIILVLAKYFYAALKFFPNIKLKEEQEVCIRSIVLDKMDVLAVLPTGYGKSIIYQILPKVISELRYNHTGDRKTVTVIVVSPLEQIRKQQVERLNVRGIKSASLEDVKASDDKECFANSRSVGDRSGERDRGFSSSVEYPNDLYSSENSL